MPPVTSRSWATREIRCSSTASTANNINVSGSFIQLKNLRLKQSNNNSINVQNGSHHIWIESIYHENISASRNYDDAGISISDNTHNVYVLSNEFYSASLTNFNIPGNAWDQAGAGIYINAFPNPIGTFVFKNNIISGGFRDCIGNAVESWGNGTVDNSDIAYNYVTGCKDDGIQMEGDDVNLRIFGNVIDATGWSCIANEVALVGPVYIFRNICRLHGSNSGYAFKLSGSPGYAFYIHNTVDTTGGASSDGWGGGGSKRFNSFTTTSSGRAALGSMPSGAVTPVSGRSIAMSRATSTPTCTCAMEHTSTPLAARAIARSRPSARRRARRRTGSRATRSLSTPPDASAPPVRPTTQEL